MLAEKQIIDIRPQEAKSIKELAPRLSLDEETLERLLKRVSTSHYKSFGVRPFDLIYDPTLGSIVRANSSIGYIDAGAFLIRLNPSVEGLEIGKCIGLAQKCGFGFLSRYRDEIVRRNLSDVESYSAIDFFAQSLMAAVSVVITNGLDRKLQEEIKEAVKLGGNIRFQESIERASIKTKPFVSEIMPNHNTPPNRYILTALLKCKEKCKAKSVIRWATSLIDHFKEVSGYGSLEEVETISQSYFSVPRADYEQALLLSKIVLDGTDWRPGAREGFLPMFTLDLDALFEKYVSEMLKQLLSSKKFVVEIQNEYKHPTKPYVFWKSFVPDVVIRLAKGNGFPVVLDVKNKYSMAIRQGAGYIGNEDVFQISYYCHALKSPVGFLVFPGGRGDSTKYPLHSSEGEAAYEEKRKRALDKINSMNKIKLFVGAGKVELTVFKWVADLTGTLRDSTASTASLAQFIADLMEGKDGFGSASFPFLRMRRS